jgi:hypothetical protein
MKIGFHISEKTNTKILMLRSLTLAEHNKKKEFF